MSKRHSDIDEMIKDICGPRSKFYKDWMKGKSKRDILIDKWIDNLLKKIKEEKDGTSNGANKIGQRRKHNSANSKKSAKKIGVARRGRG